MMVVNYTIILRRNCLERGHNRECSRSPAFSRFGEVCILLVIAHLFDRTVTPQRNDMRYRRVCPVPGFRSKPQKKLSNHITYKHLALSHIERQRYLRIARRLDVPREKRPVDVRQPTLTQVLPRPADARQANTPQVVPRMADGRQPTVSSASQPSRSNLEEPEADDDAEEEPAFPGTSEDDVFTSGTRHFPKFDVEHPVFYRFERYLMGLDGGDKCGKTAREMAVDVSKYLKYACGSDAPSSNWSKLAERDQLIGYLEKLKRCNVGPEGRLAKLDTLQAAMRFIKFHVVVEESHPMYHKLTLADNMVAAWKKTLRKEKRRRRKVRLQNLSAQELFLNEVTALLENKPIWADFNDTCIAADRGETVSVKILDQAAVVVATSLLYKNWQRPGAVTNATLKEFEESMVLRKGELYSMHVEHHKTAVEGVAKVIMDSVDHGRVLHYVHTVRQVQLGGSESDLLFVRSGGMPLGNLSLKAKSVGARYGLALPSATRVRKIGATSVALNLGQSSQASLVTRQMSHSMSTEGLYYQAIVGDTHATEAFSTMAELRKTPDRQAPVQSNRQEAPGLERQTTPQRRRPFTEEETKAVGEYFARDIEEGHSVPLAECKGFLQTHKLQRLPKNIQDKVRTLARSMDTSSCSEMASFS